MMGGAKVHYDGIVAFSQSDFTEDLKKISVPVLVMHSDGDQSSVCGLRALSAKPRCGAVANTVTTTSPDSSRSLL